MEVVVGGLQLHRLVPHRGLHAQLRAPVELDEGAVAGLIEQAVAVHAEAFNHAQRAREGAVAHRPHDHVGRFGGQRDEVPERVVCTGGLREGAVRLHLHRMHQVRELHRILDEEYRDVVADQVPVAFFGIELDGKAAHITRGVHRAGAAGHGGEAGEYRCLDPDLGQHPRAGVPGQRMGQFEVPMGTAAAGMHDALGNAFMVEVGDLLAQDEVFQQGRAARAGLERVLVVGHRDALVGGQLRMAATGLLLQFIAIAAQVLAGLGRFGVRRDVLGCHVGGLLWWVQGRHRGRKAVNTTSPRAECAVSPVVCRQRPPIAFIPATRSTDMAESGVRPRCHYRFQRRTSSGWPPFPVLLLVR